MRRGCDAKQFSPWASTFAPPVTESAKPAKTQNGSWRKWWAFTLRINWFTGFIGANWGEINWTQVAKWKLIHWRQSHFVPSGVSPRGWSHHYSLTWYSRRCSFALQTVLWCQNQSKTRPKRRSITLNRLWQYSDRKVLTSGRLYLMCIWRHPTTHYCKQDIEQQRTVVLEEEHFHLDIAGKLLMMSACLSHLWHFEAVPTSEEISPRVYMNADKQGPVGGSTT